MSWSAAFSGACCLGDFPKWQSVYYYFRQWQQDGTWQRIHDTLHAQGARLRPVVTSIRRPRCPGLAKRQNHLRVAASAALTVASESKGARRHLLVDTLGLLIAVAVTAARCLGKRRCQAPGSSGSVVVPRSYAASGWMAATKPDSSRGSQIVFVSVCNKSCAVTSKRALSYCHVGGAVERTFAWHANCRRLSKDYEALTATSEMCIYIAMTRLMLRRLKPI